MARQIDYVTLYVHVARKPDGTYEKRLQSISACVCDPDPATGKEIDRQPIVHSDPANYGLTFDGTKTLDQITADALSSVADKSGVALFTGRVLNRTTKEYLVGVDASVYSSSTWIINPNVTALASVPVKYWKITGDAVSEMSSSEKIAADSSLLPAVRGSKIAGLKLDLTDYVNKHYDSAQQSTINGLWNEANSKGWTNRKALCQQMMDWVATVMDHFYSKIDEVIAATSADAVNAVALSLTQFNATDPHVSIRTIKSTTN